MKKLLILFVLVLSLILTSCAGDKAQNNHTSTEEVSINTSKDSSSVGKKQTMQECMQGCEIMWKSNPGNNERTSADMKVDCDNLCYASIGIQNNDLELCEKSEDVLLKGGCYTEVAKVKKDSSICDKVTDSTLKNACYSSVAEDLKDLSICEKIDSDIFKQLCIDTIKNS
ncbi:hypothetical protein HGA92_02700 [Candidatus Gracilibacteria bacterium]|nr:hypothetical protein [Candidatus Gracilibacteria bacterium]NUJ98326.1 hypothetical protein [Candidatus Gracilibacteria bacterium]NUJ99319.1 hypothetical protein [Candidatus Gracilibacteria bacterium]